MLIPMIQGGITLMGGYVIEGSGLFQGSSDFLDFTPSSGSAETDFTLEMLVKLAKINSGDWLFSVDVSSTSFFFVYLNTDGDIYIKNQTSGSTNWEYHTPSVFRDPSAWLHLVLSVGTGSNDVTLYANGTSVPLTADTTKGSSATCHINSTASHEIGDRSNNSNSFDGYYARCTGIMGTKYTAASFGETTSDGFWSISDVSGLTFGANGWLIEGGTNVAAGFDSSSGSNPVYTGSSASVGFSGANAANVIDRTRSTTSTTGNLGDLASTGDDGRVVWEVDLGSSKAIKQINVAGISGTNIGDLAGFDLAHSTDSSSWTVMGSRSNISTTARDYTVTGDVTGRYIAVLAKAINWGSSAWTAAVLEASSEINNSFIKAGTITATNSSPTNGDA